MKSFLRLILFLILMIPTNLFGQESGYQFPTFAEPPGPENVLVVYRENHPYSAQIKEYYMEKRNIPLNTHEKDITIPTDPPPSGITFLNDDEVIQGEGFTAWNFVKEVIADEIEDHLNTTYYNGELLRDLIRYIVLCKGMPLKIDDINSFEETRRTDVSVDALLCLINQEPGKHFIDLYETSLGLINTYSNPYYNADDRYTMDYRFITNHFVNNEGWKLQYLVSRLDGDSQEEIEDMIDNAFIADQTGDKTWILDHHEFTPNPKNDVQITYNSFIALGGDKLNYDGFNPDVNTPITDNQLYN